MLIKSISLFGIMLFYLNTEAQKLIKQLLTKKEIASGILSIYQLNEFENHYRIVLYKNHSFSYKMTSTNYHSISNGQWRKSKNVLSLHSYIDSNNVQIKISYLNTEPLREYLPALDRTANNFSYKTIFQVPVNSDGVALPDSKVFINTDSTFCFPFFDTCVGNIAKYERIKVDFGNGFKTQWTPLKGGKYKHILIVAQTDLNLNNYHSFINQKFILKKNELEMWRN